MINLVATLLLENEMDLILANKRTMKLAELCGLTLTLQTGLATAVSEIARCALSMGKRSSLQLGINVLAANRKQISAVVSNTSDSCAGTEAFEFARRLITEIRLTRATETSYDIHLNQDIRFAATITEDKLESFIEYFKNEPVLSPYDEIRRKGLMLLEFSDKLRESESQYRKLAETLPLMMFVANREGEVTYTNKWFENVLGNSLTSIAPFSGQELTHPDDFAATNKTWQICFKYGKPFTAQARLRSKKDGTFLWHLISIQPVKNESNTIIQWTGFFVDINAQKIVGETLKDNAELNAAKKTLVDSQRLLKEKIGELNTSNSELEQFAYIASHDLQEPLRKISTFSTLLEAKLENLDPETRMYFSKIVASSVQMKNQIKDVLEWSGFAKAKEKFSPVDLNEIVESVKSDLEILIQEKKAVVDTSSLPLVHGAPLQLVRLFSNLVRNAIKFCDKAPVITIRYKNLSLGEVRLRKQLDKSLRYAEVTVSDNGIGFEQEFADHIFKIFQRLNGHERYEGTGIGLSICRKIAENHKGEIYATGKPGMGATFTIILPVAHLKEN